MQLTMRGFYGIGTHPRSSKILQLCMCPSYFWRGLTPPDPPLFRTLNQSTSDFHLQMETHVSLALPTPEGWMAELT